MSRLPFEAFLAFRYLRPRRTFVSVITVISVIGVLLGVAVLIVVIAVMSGFDQEWRERIGGFNAHLKVYAGEGGQALTNYESVIRSVASDPDVTGVSPFIGGQVLVKTEPQTGPGHSAAPLLLGVDQETLGQVNVLPKSIIAGNFDLTDKGLVIGEDFAARMGLAVGDRLAIYSTSTIEKMQASIGKTNAEVFLPEDFTVRGIFDVGSPDYNSQIVVASLDDARDLESLPEDSVQGLQVKLRDAFRADEAARRVQSLRGQPLAVVTWRQENPEIFNALATEKNTMFIVLFFIMIVAAFGIVNSQITFVVQKTREIGILKAIGASGGQILWLFLSQSIVVAILGVGLGLGTAMVALHYRNEFLHFLREVTHTEILPSSIYHVYDLPASIQSQDVLIICGTAFMACVLAGVFPAWKASRLQPVEALRYE
jgi:lipoprotein-releasing system permease protein